MKAYYKLCKLTDSLLEADNPEAKTIAEEKLREFRSYDNYKNTRPDIEDAVNVLSDAVNIMGGYNTPKTFVECMNKQHRTLQQGMTRLFLEWFKYLSILEDGCYDARNEQSVRIAKSIISWLKFVDELERYHSMDRINENPNIMYLEDHKDELRQFIEFVKECGSFDNDYITHLSVI